MLGGILATRIRSDEKLLLEAFKKRKVDVEILDLRAAQFPLVCRSLPYDFVLNRSIGQTEGLSAVTYFEALGIRTVNRSSVISCCGDKATMTVAFLTANLPFPRTCICYSPESALAAAAEIGYPVVLKPIIGSWGRMIVRLNDPEAAKAVFSYKENLTNLHHKIYYIQEYIEKPKRDIRVIVIDGRFICSYYRYSEGWITNVHLGGVGVVANLSDDVTDLAIRAAIAVGGGAVSVDLIEDLTGTVVVNEVNHTMEFMEASRVTGVDVADRYAAFCEAALI